MCILIHHKSTTQFNDDHLLDFYSKNSDGFGAIINTGSGIQIVKTLGKLEDIKKIYNEQILGHEAVIHFRMQTHGDIDMTNCHPYQVTEDIWMAHNGILSTGNAADTTKSDTWHYIENILKPMLNRDPELIHEPAFIKLVGDHIGGSNKFGFMDSQGRVAIVNRSAGVEHLDAWLSNTYAWTPWKFGYGTAPVQYQTGWWDNESQASRWNRGYQGTLTYGTGAGKTDPKKPVLSHQELSRKNHLGQLSTDALGKILRSTYKAMEKNEYYGLVDWVTLNPMKAMHLLHEFYRGQITKDDIAIMVHSDPDEAANWIEDLWTTCKEDCLVIAGIPHEVDYDKGDWHGYSV